MQTFRRVLLGVLCFVMVLMSVSAQSPQTAMSMCRQIENDINLMAPLPKITCSPGTGTANRSLFFIIVASRPVFAVESSKKAWLIYVVAAVGKQLNDNGAVIAEEVAVSDATLMQDRVAFTLSADLVKSLQTRVRTGQMNFDDMYLEIQRNLKRKVMPPSK